MKPYRPTPTLDIISRNISRARIQKFQALGHSSENNAFLVGLSNSGIKATLDSSQRCSKQASKRLSSSTRYLTLQGGEKKTIKKSTLSVRKYSQCTTSNEKLLQMARRKKIWSKPRRPSKSKRLRNDRNYRISRK